LDSGGWTHFVRPPGGHRRPQQRHNRLQQKRPLCNMRNPRWQDIKVKRYLDSSGI